MLYCSLLGNNEDAKLQLITARASFAFDFFLLGFSNSVLSTFLGTKEFRLLYGIGCHRDQFKAISEDRGFLA